MVRARPPRIDWSAMIFALEAANLSQREISRRCGVESHSWVNRLKSETHSEPGFHGGAMLLALWAEVFTDRPPPTV